MKSFITCALALAVSLSAASGVRADATLSPGKNVAYITQGALPVGLSYAPVASVQFIKGKKKRIIEVDVTLLDQTQNLDSIAAYVTVNGVMLEPDQTNAQVMTTCNHGIIHCTVWGHFWADMDALEAANPGVFINQPVTVTLNAVGTGIASPSSNATIRAHLTKK